MNFIKIFLGVSGASCLTAYQVIHDPSEPFYQLPMNIKEVYHFFNFFNFIKFLIIWHLTKKHWHFLSDAIFLLFATILGSHISCSLVIPKVDDWFSRPNMASKSEFYSWIGSKIHFEQRPAGLQRTWSEHYVERFVTYALIDARSSNRKANHN